MKKKKMSRFKDFPYIHIMFISSVFEPWDPDVKKKWQSHDSCISKTSIPPTPPESPRVLVKVNLSKERHHGISIEMKLLRSFCTLKYRNSDSKDCAKDHDKPLPMLL